jgi:hypothetical protein
MTIHSWREKYRLRIMIGFTITDERTSMNTDAGFRLSRFAQQKQRARRVRIGVMLVLCALPVAVALAKASLPALAQVASL